MKSPFSPLSRTPPLDTRQGRQQAVAFALRFTQGTPLAPGPREQQLLGYFVRGELTLDEVTAILEAQKLN